MADAQSRSQSGAPIERCVPVSALLDNSTLYLKVVCMNDRWAAENLHTIRTLMERAALYRRALAPLMIVAGTLGLVAAGAGWKLDVAAPAGFVSYWLAVAAVTLLAAMVLVRRQALRQGEPFWSPPTRRVAQAMLPGLAAGFLLGLWVVGGGGSRSGLADPPTGGWPPGYLSHVGLPLLWVILYGCAVHAAGFFMERGIRLFGWALLLLGCGGFLAGVPQTTEGLVNFGHGVMGLAFGFLHLGYGLYLFATEKRAGAE
jgi:hypothetical protein